MPCDFYIYLHRRATDGAVFYVGKGHSNRAWSTDRRNPHWRAVAAKHGYTVQIVEDGLRDWYAYEREREMVALCRENGCKLTNMTDGGDGVMGYKFTDEHRAKVSARAKAAWQTDEYRSRVVSAARDGVLRTWADPEHKAKRVQKIRARTSTPEWSARVSDANFKAWADPYKRACRLDAMRASKESVEYREKASKAQNMRWQNQKARDAARIAKESKMRPVVCEQTGRVFAAMKDAQRWLISEGFAAANTSNVRAVCQGKMKTAYGYRWQYTEASR